jgi:hypothetical protein
VRGFFLNSTANPSLLPTVNKKVLVTGVDLKSKLAQPEQDVFSPKSASGVIMSASTIAGYSR